MRSTGPEALRQPEPLPNFGEAQRLAVPPDAAVDAAIIQRVLDGEAEAFAELVSRYQRRAYFVALHLVGSSEDARDVVQDAFVRVHRSLDRFDFGRNFYTWFYRIVSNLAIDALRKRRAARSVALETIGERASEDAGPENVVELEETRDRVWQVLDSLDGKFRTVLVFRDIHGLSCREIVPILGATHATVRWRLHRGRQLFREAWERSLRTEGGA